MWFETFHFFEENSKRGSCFVFCTLSGNRVRAHTRSQFILRSISPTTTTMQLCLRCSKPIPVVYKHLWIVLPFYWDGESGSKGGEKAGDGTPV